MDAKPNREVSAQPQFDPIQPPWSAMDAKPKREVSAQNASIETLSVTIKAMVINGKQMTLSVFRQLPTCNAYCEDGSLHPDRDWWGIVRYWIKEEGSVWAVCRVGDKLCRASTSIHERFGEIDNLRLRLRRAIETRDTYNTISEMKAEYERLRKTYDESRSRLRNDCPIPKIVCVARGYDVIESASVAAREEWIQSRCPPWPRQPDYPSLPSPYNKWVEGEQGKYEIDVERYEYQITWCERAMDSRSVLLSLAQLFIAV